MTCDAATIHLMGKDCTSFSGVAAGHLPLIPFSSALHGYGAGNSANVGEGNLLHKATQKGTAPQNPFARTIGTQKPKKD